MKTKGGADVYSVELASVSALRAHPRNYREHPEDQRAHIAQSIREHGLYRNVVVAQDGTILAGHGVVEAARAEGLEEVMVVRLPYEPDDPKALKVLTGDNETSRRAEIDDRVLADLLRDIRETDDLLGTGFDDSMLAALVLVTRPSSEIEDFDAAAHWAGLPEFEGMTPRIQLTLNFDSEEEREALAGKLGLVTSKPAGEARWSAWWPPREREDPNSLRFEG